MYTEKDKRFVKDIYNGVIDLVDAKTAKGILHDIVDLTFRGGFTTYNAYHSYFYWESRKSR